MALICSFALLTGCGKGAYDSVSGTITVNGQPMENVQVVFAPIASATTNSPGPPSLAVTDATGHYELKTRDGALGAISGTHRVSFKYADLKDVADLKFALGRADSKEMAAEYKAKIAHVESEMKRRGAISRKAMTTFVVPEGGVDNADFEIGEQK